MICPYKLPADVWMDDPTQWPPLSYPDLYHYLIELTYIQIILNIYLNKLTGDEML